jgi:hypothetical protein
MATTTNTPATTTNCLRCGRTLRNTTPDGYGPKCRIKVRNAARAKTIAAFKPATVTKAQELIEQGGLIPLRGRVFQVIASNGVDRYLTHPAACNCPAGLKARHACYHRAAAAIVTAA